jgi:hypothetical protein
MTLERILSVFAFLTLCGFLAVLIICVPRLDLGGALLVCVVLCGYDLFVRGARAGRR